MVQGAPAPDEASCTTPTQRGHDAVHGLRRAGVGLGFRNQGAPAPVEASCTTPTSAATTPSTACARLLGASEWAPAVAAAASAGAKQRFTSGCTRARPLGAGGSVCGQQGSARHACDCQGQPLLL